MKHNYEIILELRNDLNDDDKNFIIQKINNLKDRFELIQEGNKIFKYENNLSYDDVPYCIMFCMHISKFKSYFKTIYYNSLCEGVTEIIEESIRNEKEPNSEEEKEYIKSLNSKLENSPF